MKTHEELKDLLGVYALNALDTDQRRELETHLSTCRSCTAELRDHLETLAALTDDDNELPGRVWEQIAGSLEEQPRPKAPMRRPARWWVPTRLGFALGVAALLVFAVMGARLIQQEQRLDTLTRAISRQSIADLARTAESDPRALVLSLQSPDRSRFARVVILPDGGGYLTADNLEEVSPDKTYQLWALRGDERISLGVLGTDPDVAAFRTVAGASGFAITIEKAGGVPMTTNNPVVFGFIEG